MNMLKEFLRNRVVLVDLLVVLFGISSWISINGVWVELPLLVQHAPEGWALPSYLAITVQLANIGPILYGLLRSCLSHPPSQSISITTLLIVGVVASLSMALSWHITWQDKHSLGLLISVFFLSLVDCTSSVLFLPYMAMLRQVYLNSYLVGEGMSGFVPAIAALAQGVSGNPVCQNVTLDNGTTVVQPVSGDPRFNTSAFFYFLMAMMILSLLSFLMLEYLPTARTEKLGRQSNSSFTTAVVDHQDMFDSQSQEAAPPPPTRYSLPLLLTVQLMVCFLSNGALPSIQSYSCLPYGNTVYHLSVTLNAMANPLMAFLAFFLPCVRQRLVAILTLFGVLSSGFILATALESPNMLTDGSWIVLAWVITGAVFSYIKVSVAGMCREVGSLFSCGVVTQAGSALGAVVMFLLVNQVDLFQGYYVSCSN